MFNSRVRSGVDKLNMQKTSAIKEDFGSRRAKEQASGRQSYYQPSDLK
jgi:hypothetical protein